MALYRFFYKKSQTILTMNFIFWLLNYYKMILNNILPKILTNN